VCGVTHLSTISRMSFQKKLFRIVGANEYDYRDDKKNRAAEECSQKVIGEAKNFAVWLQRRTLSKGLIRGKSRYSWR